MVQEDTEQYKLQNDQYRFPYHWAQFENNFNHFSNYQGKTYYTVFMRHVMEIIKELAPTSICDIGCGDGVLISYLQKEGIGSSWVGVDMSDKAIAFAKIFNNEVEWFCGDFKNVITDRKFSLVTCTEVLEHIPDEMLSDFIKGLFDRIDQNGKLLITVPTIAKPVSKKHFRHYSVDLLEEELKEAGVEYEIINKHNYIKRTWLWNLYVSVCFRGKIFWKANFLEGKAFGYFKRCASRCRSDLEGEKLIVCLRKK